MGDWSREPWGNDEAADWFHQLWDKCDIELLVNEIMNFSPEEERYDSIRAACYLLEVLGIVYVWPAKYMSILKELLAKAIAILKNMINPPTKEWGFLDMWGYDPLIIEAVNAQINTLQKRLSNIV